MTGWLTRGSKSYGRLGGTLGPFPPKSVSLATAAGDFSTLIDFSDLFFALSDTGGRIATASFLFPCILWLLAISTVLYPQLQEEDF